MKRGRRWSSGSTTREGKQCGKSRKKGKEERVGEKVEEEEEGKA